ncbi:MAG: thiamine phosphate synthase [Alphaproteobacteria bacterium]|nr:thiamine phosphate synthase [Alphaproteobacteria bacterium]
MKRTAALLNRAARPRKALPHLLFFTDPARTPDPEAIAAALPRGAGIVFRAFGAVDADEQGRRLKRIAVARGLKLLVGADPALAARIGAHGVHLPERAAAKSRTLKSLRPGWIVTCAAHSLPAALRARRSGADAAVVSAVFASRSPSAGAPIGPMRLAALVRGAGLPVYALGGVSNQTARRLVDAGLVGLAAVEGFRPRS